MLQHECQLFVNTNMTEEKVFQRITTKEISMRTEHARTGAIKAALLLVFSMMVVDKASALPIGCKNSAGA
jgi:hypothetical protein